MNDREKLIDLIRHEVVPYFAERIADHLIANGVVVRKKGEWEPVLNECGQQCEEEIYASVWRCPVCGEENFRSGFCPDCGSDMRKGDA